MAFSNDISTVLDRSLGSMEKTDNPLNLAISTPDNYFAIRTPMGTRYTRDGNFYLNKENMIVTKDGFPLLNSEGTDISINTDSLVNIKVDRNGVIFADGAAVDKIGVYCFSHPYNLRKEGKVLLYTDEEAQIAKDFQIMQGMTEESNAPSVIEMNDLINTSRHFDQATNFNNTIHKLSNEMLQVLLKAE